MSRLTKKHVLALTAAGAMMLGATAASAGPGGFDGTMRFSNTDNVTHVRSRSHQRAWRHQNARRSNAELGPFGWPGAAAAAAGATVAGAGYAAGSLIGGPTVGMYGAYDDPYGAYASSNYYGYRDSRGTPGFNAPAGAVHGQHYETPIGDGSLYTSPNGLPMGPQ